MDAREKMKALAAKHGLGFLFDPGGGAFNRSDLGSCRISTYDDDEDLETLRAWLRSKGLED